LYIAIDATRVSLGIFPPIIKITPNSPIVCANVIIAAKNRFEVFKKRINIHNRITMLQPVPGSEVVDTIKDFDLGIHLLEPINFNHKYSLPNKILEFIQARLAVVIGPSPGMIDIVENYKVGIISEDFSAESVARAISSISANDILEYKQNSDKASRELSYESNIEKLNNLVDKVLE